MSLNYRLLLSPLGLLPLAAQPAEAADLPVKARPMPAVADPHPPSWAGFYGGANVGWVADRSRQTAFRPPTDPSGVGYCWADNCGFKNSQTANGVIGGVQLGYNFQAGQWIYGIETDFSWSNANNRKTSSNGPAGALGLGTPGNWIAETGISALGTTRGRVGYAFGQLMVYGTGGVAYADKKNTFTFTDNPALAATHSGTGWRTGWTAGGGVERQLAANWSVKAEGLYYDLGSVDHVSNSPPLIAFSHVGIRDRMTGTVARVGLNYLFH
jgi:outer membrane immunogenic protein